MIAPLAVPVGSWIMRQGMAGFLCFSLATLLLPVVIGTFIRTRSVVVATIFNLSIVAYVVVHNVFRVEMRHSDLTTIITGFGVFGMIAVAFAWTAALPGLLREPERPGSRDATPRPDPERTAREPS